MRGPMRCQEPEERGKYEERQAPQPRIQYKQEPMIGTETRDYSTPEARER